jgi:YggT family protein
MESENLFWAYWYYQIPNYVLGVLFWTCLGRFLLGLFVPPHSTNYIWRWFRRLTDPVLVATDWITPHYILPFFMPLVAAFWLGFLRLVLLVALTALDLAPKLAPAVGG